MPRTEHCRDEPFAPAGVVDHPCTRAQKRAWILNQLHPGNPALNVAVRWRIDGAVPTEAIESAFLRVIARHDALRASFSEVDGEPRQVVHDDQVAFRLPEVHLTRLTPEAAAAEADRIAELEARASFDLSSPPPLLRATRLCLHDGVSILLVTAHQLVFDAWSIGLLERELDALCAAGGRPQGSRLPPLPVDYAAVAEEESRRAGSEPHAVDYWR
ncbi:MAG TPA: condensation domain-containing protein, partial [Nevskiaceae bacterium]|nr:condensation domain-containing protein [Nevskiaceae bacterium]